MRQFFFHLVDGNDRLLDDEGSWLPDVGAVVAKALQEARCMIAADIMASGVLETRYRIDVEDSDGSVIHRLAFADAVQRSACAPQGHSRLQ